MFGRGQTTKQIGDRAERCAETHLRQQGLNTVTKNFHCKGGEVDLIMRHGDRLVFVEVRYRRRTEFGDGSDSVDYRKQQKVITAARSYLQKHQLTEHQACRFDVVSLHGDLDHPSIDWIENAFGVSDC